MLALLRRLVPRRPLTHHEALRIAELQANRLLEHFDITTNAVPDEIITELPRIRVEREHGLPVSGGAHWNGRYWVITLSADEHPLRQRFSLAHEFKHVVDHTAKDYVIVHKVDRLARNRVDDVEINLALKKAGATLVSCSENIDETPSGTLLHGIMSAIAEFYSRNLASEVIKGSVQKAKAGGTLGKAPVGYLNVRKLDRGRETRTVEVDELRAPLVQWAFEQYATGEWSLSRLTRALADRGLTNRATTHFAEKPLTKASIHRMLRNRYYIGKMTWQSVEYDGAHPRFIESDVCHAAYQDARPQIRRRLNQAVFERFLVGDDGSTEAEVTDRFSSLLAPDLVIADEPHETVESCNRHRNRDWFNGIPTWLRAHWNLKEPRPALASLGLNKGHMVRVKRL